MSTEQGLQNSAKIRKEPLAKRKNPQSNRKTPRYFDGRCKAAGGDATSGPTCICRS
jgi:hypothetical protein